MAMTEHAAMQDLIRRVLQDGKFDLVPIWFQSSVLDRYRGNAECRILRTDSAGRLKGPGGWMINFGISPDDELIHLPIATALGIPERERDHWLGHLASLPVGANFLRMTVNPYACIGDGETRDW